MNRGSSAVSISTHLLVIEEAENMKIPKVTAVMVGATMLMVAGCTNKPILTHKLVVTGGQHSIPLYPDEATFLKVSHLAQQDKALLELGSIVEPPVSDRGQLSRGPTYNERKGWQWQRNPQKKVWKQGFAEG
jgi:hypothetical protein